MTSPTNHRFVLSRRILHRESPVRRRAFLRAAVRGASSSSGLRLKDKSDRKLAHAGACISGGVDVILQVDGAADTAQWRSAIYRPAEPARCTRRAERNAVEEVI